MWLAGLKPPSVQGYASDRVICQHLYGIVFMAVLNETASRAKLLANLRIALEGTAEDLHGIVSRTSAAEVAAEVVRLNTEVRHGAAGRIGPFDQPLDFFGALLSGADLTNGKSRP